MKSINTWWMVSPAPGNVGDIITPYILKQLGYKPIYTAKSPKLLCVGSLLQIAQASDTIWGCGIIDRNRPVKARKILAVRGPISRDKANIDCPIGDPALLMPQFYQPQVTKLRCTGYVPHYVDYSINYQDLYKVKVLNANPLKVIDEICQFDNIVSTSLHGIILAHAYGIPAKWVKLSNNLCGDDVKFQDYALSVGIKDLTKFCLPEKLPNLTALVGVLHDNYH